jgi:hypothetical protein
MTELEMDGSVYLGLASSFLYILDAIISAQLRSPRHSTRHVVCAFIENEKKNQYVKLF